MAQTEEPTTKVTIYSTSWCAYCRAEKQYLSSKGVAYEDIDVEADQSAAEEMFKLSHQMGVPFTVITRPDGEKVNILGFDQERLDRELQLA